MDVVETVDEDDRQVPAGASLGRELPELRTQTLTQQAKLLVGRQQRPPTTTPLDLQQQIVQQRARLRARGGGCVVVGDVRVVARHYIGVAELVTGADDVTVADCVHEAVRQETLGNAGVVDDLCPDVRRALGLGREKRQAELVDPPDAVENLGKMSTQRYVGDGREGAVPKSGGMRGRA